MKIDRFTEIINVEDKTFLFNSKTGAIDEADAHIVKEINKLRKKGSFTPLECSLEGYLIEDMIERGYITYYSNKEEAAEQRWLLEKYKVKAKKEEKTVSLILDSIVGKNWCLTDGTMENSAINEMEFMNLLRVINAEKLANEIDLWMIIKDKKSDWNWIVKQADKNGLKIKSLYTIAENEIVLEEINNWLWKSSEGISFLSLADIPTGKTSIQLPTTINIKYKQEKFIYLSFSKLGKETFKKDNKITFLNRHPFFVHLFIKHFSLTKPAVFSIVLKKLEVGKNLNYAA